VTRHLLEIGNFVFVKLSAPDGKRLSK